jgi:Fe-S cluster assembly ATP-binding protein
MAPLKPALASLEETDYGPDVNALRTVADGVNAVRRPVRAMIIVTFYQRLLDYIEPDFVHVQANGRIVGSGDKSLSL